MPDSLGKRQPNRPAGREQPRLLASPYQPCPSRGRLRSDPTETAVRTGTRAPHCISERRPGLGASGTWDPVAGLPDASCGRFETSQKKKMQDLQEAIKSPPILEKAWGHSSRGASLLCFPCPAKIIRHSSVSSELCLCISIWHWWTGSQDSGKGMQVGTAGTSAGTSWY